MQLDANSGGNVFHIAGQLTQCPFSDGTTCYNDTSAGNIWEYVSSSATSTAIKSPAFQATKGTFSALAACSAGLEGTTGAVTDSATNTWGATITGSGSNHVLAYCDGTNWTVAAN